MWYVDSLGGAFYIVHTRKTIRMVGLSLLAGTHHTGIMEPEGEKKERLFFSWIKRPRGTGCSQKKPKADWLHILSVSVWRSFYFFTPLRQNISLLA